MLGLIVETWGKIEGASRELADELVRRWMLGTVGGAMMVVFILWLYVGLVLCSRHGGFMLLAVCCCSLFRVSS